MSDRDRVSAIALAGVGAASYLAAGIGLLTNYDYYGRLAQALLEGRYWLSDAPSWLNELLGCGDGRFCVAYPPLPALLTVPFALFAAAPLAQALMARAVGGASAGALFWALRLWGAPMPYALVGAALSMFGTTLFFSSVDARAEYAAHSVAMLLTCAALAFAARGSAVWIAGVALGLGGLARLPVAAAAPALAWLAARRGALPYRRALLLVALGGAPFAVVYFGYDLLRWGTPLDAGPARLAEGDVFFARGLLSPLYLPRHLYAIFVQPPDFVDGTPWFLRPRYDGMSLFLTTPAFLWVFAALREARRSVAIGAAALATLLALLPDVLGGSYGVQQFGYRFSIDAQPYLVALALAGDGLSRGMWRSRPSLLFLVAVALSIAVNVYGTVALTRFGYWQ